MPKLIESTFVTLDGVIGDPQVWGMGYWDEQHHGYAQGLLDNAEALVLGRETYEVFAQAWPQRSGDPYTDKINAMPKHIATRSLTGSLDWNATAIEGEVAEAVTSLKTTASGDLLKFGTGQVDKALLDADLIDELHLWVFPVVAGSGQRLMDGHDGPTHFTLARTETFDSGIVVHVLTPKQS